MKLVFFSNSLNHHQVNVADELYHLLGGEFAFVATGERNSVNLKGGLDYTSRPYCIVACDNDESYRQSMSLAIESEACVFGASSQIYAVERAKRNPQGLSFEMAERWLKHGWLTIGSPVFRKWWLNYMRYFRKANFSKLCMSAFAACDDEKVGAYRGRHYKWGYFTEVKDNIEESIMDSKTREIVLLMWCGRFLKLKHPEIPVQMAMRLKAKSINFVLDMYGSGDEEEQTKYLAYNLGVGDIVRFHGSLPNDEILDAMRCHDIFLFTSDRKEGWGAVANESLSNLCVLVASDAIGSTQYLIKDGFNGFKFKSRDVDDLTEKVEWLITHKSSMRKMQWNAYVNMRDVWSPKHAAENLLTLINDLSNKREPSILDGPCSKA